jgi:hypothetical protein
LESSWAELGAGVLFGIAMATGPEGCAFASEVLARGGIFRSAVLLEAYWGIYAALDPLKSGVLRSGAKRAGSFDASVVSS